eukprot:jgi/Botrbrau1/14364/Bobra.0014s0019.1
MPGLSSTCGTKASHPVTRRQANVNVCPRSSDIRREIDFSVPVKMALTQQRGAMPDTRCKGTEIDTYIIASVARDLSQVLTADLDAFASEASCRLLDVFGGDDLLYCRVTAVATRSPRLYLGTIGNLALGCTNVGVLRCPRKPFEQLAADGYYIEVLDSSRNLRGPGLHSKLQAYQDVGATLIASVPICAAQESFGDGSSRVLGMLTLGWRTKEAGHRYIPAMQEVAREMSPGFEDAAQPLTDQVVHHFLHSAAPKPRPRTPDALQGDACLHDNAEDHHDRDSAAGPSVPSSGGPLTSVPSFQTRPWWEFDDVSAQKESLKKAASGLLGPGVGGLNFPEENFKSAISPVWLAFKDRDMEEQFCLSQAVKCRTADICVDSILIAANLLFYDKVLAAGWGPFPALSVVFTHLCFLLLKPAWYRKHRSNLCVMFATMIPTFLAWVMVSALNTPVVTQDMLPSLAKRELLAMPGIHALVCLGHRIEFWKALLLRAPVATLACLYSSVCIGMRAWGTSTVLTTVIMGTPALIAYAAALAYTRSQELKARRNFFVVTYARTLVPGSLRSAPEAVPIPTGA